jgi:hypothetical protein
MDELLSVYGAIKGGSLDYKASGAPLQSGSSGYPVTSAGLTITVGDLTGDIAEVLIYDFKLSVSQQSALDLRNNTKYDGLPHDVAPPPPALLPPFLPNLQHWWDFTDAATVFADTLAAVPITDGTIFQRVNDKGTAGDDIFDAASTVTWHSGIVNGLSIIRNTSGVASPRFTSQVLAFGNIGGPNSFTQAMVNRAFAVPPGNGKVTQIDNGPTNISFETGFGNWAEEHQLSGFTGSNKAIIINEWVEQIVTDGVNFGAHIVHVSGAADVVLPQGYLNQLATSVEIFASTVTGEIGEMLVYDRDFSPAELLVLEAYFDTKYLALPHL